MSEEKGLDRVLRLRGKWRQKIKGEKVSIFGEKGEESDLRKKG
jgi:hypothetical protein